MGERRKSWWNREKSENLLQQKERLRDSPSASLRIDLASAIRQYQSGKQEIPTVKDTKSNITTSRLCIFACCCIFLYIFLPVLFHAKQSAIRLFDNLVALYRSLI